MSQFEFMFVFFHFRKDIFYLDFWVGTIRLGLNYNDLMTCRLRLISLGTFSLISSSPIARVILNNVALIESFR